MGIKIWPWEQKWDHWDRDSIMGKEWAHSGRSGALWASRMGLRTGDMTVRDGALASGEGLGSEMVSEYQLGPTTRNLLWCKQQVGP